MKYNKCLDFAALAIQAANRGKPLLAARFFARAATADDAQDALRIVEASNGRAWEQAQEEQRKIAAAAKAEKAKPAVKAAAKPAEKAKPAVASKARVAVAAAECKASEEEEIGDDEEGLVGDEELDDLELGADLVEDQDSLEEQLPQESLAGDLAELDEGFEDEAEEEAEGEPEPDDDDAAAFAAVLASMQKNAGKAKAKK